VPLRISPRISFAADVIHSFWLPSIAGKKWTSFRRGLPASRSSRTQVDGPGPRHRQPVARGSERRPMTDLPRLTERGGIVYVFSLP
jgi:hypothetical protein